MRAPDHQNDAVSIWKIQPCTPRLEAAHAASLGCWIVNGPFHPFWSWWMVGVIHLRDIEGCRPAQKQSPDKTHEFIIVSLNPDRCPVDVDALERDGDWGDRSKPKFLDPPDVVFQFSNLTDAQALRVADAAIARILDGTIPPDSDYRTAWENALAATAAHERAGEHGD